MTHKLAEAPEAATPAAAPAVAAMPWPLLAAAVAGLAALGLAWAGGCAGLLGAALAATALWLVRRPAPGGQPQPPAARPRPAAGLGDRMGAELMVSQVVPVWSRQLEATREAASEGLTQLLQTFSEISSSLGSLAGNLGAFSVTATPGAVDGAVRRESPALDALTAASTRAFAERDAAVAELQRCGTGLTELLQLAKQARELARHTRLVAFNASIEANRLAAGTQGGAQAVASELRMLSAHIGDTGEQIERIAKALNAGITQSTRAALIGDTTPEELRLEIDLRAREAMAALLGGLAGALDGSGEVQQLSQSLAGRLEETFVHFQFGDRVSQMLSIVANDMGNLAAWLAQHPQATHADAAEWLAALEASYTMEEQRSSHHGNVHIEQDAGVEFF
jgi:methyl-accepting chemotaxis protein